MEIKKKKKKIPNAELNPALLIRTSILPNLEIAPATAFSISAFFVTSKTNATAKYIKICVLQN
jgi:hypothetical protein